MALNVAQAKAAGGVFAKLRFNTLLGAGNNRNDAVRIGRRDIGKIACKIGGEGGRGIFIRNDSDNFGISVSFDAHFANFVGEENRSGAVRQFPRVTHTNLLE